MMRHKMDKSEQQLHQDLKTREVRLLVPLISVCLVGKRGVAFCADTGSGWS
jgi:hypothetical protein